MNDAQTLAVTVAAIEQVTPLIKHFTLVAADGGDLDGESLRVVHAYTSAMGGSSPGHSASTITPM